MTSEEIKRTVFMEELVERYGLYPNRAGFIVCPFHKGDRNASLKIYKDSFYCFGCGAAGDVFDFVRKMDGMSFKEAFLFLGGEYECKKKRSKAQARLAVYKSQKAKEERRIREQKRQETVQHNINLIDIYRTSISRSQPLSDEWCESYNALQKELLAYDMLEVQISGKVERRLL